jgi:serine/threonine protein kinase
VPEDGKVLIGRVFDDRYEVIKKLGSGGMADVFLAQDRLLGRQVALKILSSRYANDEQFIERFRREASSASRSTTAARPKERTTSRWNTWRGAPSRRSSSSTPR